MTYPADPSSGYQPSGGWGYTEWGAAGAEAWNNAGDATAAGDPTTAAHWTEVAQQADTASHDVYVGGGPGYGSGGDTSGSNDGTYWGAGASADTSAAPDYQSALPAPGDEFTAGGSAESSSPTGFETGHEPVDAFVHESLDPGF